MLARPPYRLSSTDYNNLVEKAISAGIGIATRCVATDPDQIMLASLQRGKLLINSNDALSVKLKYAMIILMGTFIHVMYHEPKLWNKTYKSWWQKPYQEFYSVDVLKVMKQANPSIKQDVNYFIKNNITHSDQLENDILTLGTLALAGELPFSLEMFDDFLKYRNNRDPKYQRDYLPFTVMLKDIQLELDKFNIMKPEGKFTLVAPGFFTQISQAIVRLFASVRDGISIVFRNIRSMFSSTPANDAPSDPVNESNRSSTASTFNHFNDSSSDDEDHDADNKRNYQPTLRSRAHTLRRHDNRTNTTLHSSARAHTLHGSSRSNRSNNESRTNPSQGSGNRIHGMSEARGNVELRRGYHCYVYN